MPYRRSNVFRQCEQQRCADSGATLRRRRSPVVIAGLAAVLIAGAGMSELPAQQPAPKQPQSPAAPVAQPRPFPTFPTAPASSTLAAPRDTTRKARPVLGVRPVTP